MPHVAYELQELHAGQPNTFSVPLLDGDGVPINFGSGSAVEPVLTITDLSETVLASALPMTEVSDVWIAALPTLDVTVGVRLRLTVDFVDPEGNAVSLPYPAIVVPPV